MPDSYELHLRQIERAKMADQETKPSDQSVVMPWTNGEKPPNEEWVEVQSGDGTTTGLLRSRRMASTLANGRWCVVSSEPIQYMATKRKYLPEQ